MKISIITPSYNQADFLEQTIQSVIGQNYPDLEYFIVDGGSTDGSVEIIQKYSKKISWWISEPDSGQAEAINKGFRKSSGDIVAWLNSDDMYAPGAFFHAAEVLSGNPEIGMVYGNAVSFDQKGIPLNDLKFKNWGLKGLVSFNIICQPAVFFRRELLEEIGYLAENFHMLLDHHLWLRIARVVNIQHIPEVLAFARHHQDAKNVAQAYRFSQEAYQILDWMKSQSDLAEIISENHRYVMAMTHRFAARYILESGKGWEALKKYYKSMIANPIVALNEWHRIIFAGLTIIGLGKLGNIYYQMKKKRTPDSIKALGITNFHSIYTEFRI